MFYTMCMKCGEEWALGDERSCKCKPETNALTRDDIIRMARKANLHERTKVVGGYIVNIPNLENLERFAALVAAEKDEEIARLQGEIDRMHRDLATIIKGVMRGESQ